MLAFRHPLQLTKSPDFLDVFDFPDPNLVVGKRSNTSVPTQALFLMNSSLVRTQAQRASSAYLMLREGIGENNLVRHLYRLVLGRDPTPREQGIVSSFLRDTTDVKTTWAQIFQGLFSSSDFRYIN